MKRRYCQKFSPGPARRRPCSPWMMVAATRRASRISRGMAAASVRPSPTAWPIAWASSGTAGVLAAITGFPKSLSGRLADLGLEPADHARDGLAVGTRREGERHAVLEDRLGERDHVVDRGRVASLDERAGAHREHQRLARAR